MLNYYSVIFHPDGHIIDLFKIYKKTLFQKIGNYGSRNSPAHITILEFQATEKELSSIRKKIIKIAQEQISFFAIFNTVAYSNTVVILPDKDGNECFEQVLIYIRKKIKGIHNKSSAHLTVGRNLEPEQIKKSQNLFPDVNFNFHCNQIALRKFNKNTRQFEIQEIFPFEGLGTKEKSIQLDLFQ